MDNSDRFRLPQRSSPALSEKSSSSQYTLFPAKKKKNQKNIRKSPDKTLETNFHTSFRSSSSNMRIMRRSDNLESKPSNNSHWPGIRVRPLDQDQSFKPQSFADMVRKPGKQQDNQKHQEQKKVVLNQISSRTYSNIGKSDDNTKYVSGGASHEDEEENRSRRKTIPSAMRSDIEVEFVDSDTEQVFYGPTCYRNTIFVLIGRHNSILILIGLGW